MNVLVLDDEAVGLAFCLRAQEAGHYVKHYVGKTEQGDEEFVGQGLTDRVREWKKHMGWADLIICTGNAKMMKELKPFFDSGYPIFAPPAKGAKLELDRSCGNQCLIDHGIECLPCTEFHDFDSAIRYVESTKQAFACKPWGGEADKSLSYVADSYEDLVFTLRKWKAAGLKADFILQEKVEGIEMGVAAWHGPSGFCGLIEESWEEKKFLTGNLGQNTGEMGTTIRYTPQSALFDRVLAPLAGYLQEISYVGDVNVNCIIGLKDGIPWPLEFTARLGWPDFNIRMCLHEGDFAAHLLACLEGRDEFQSVPEIAVGVVMCHGDFPHGNMKAKDTAGYPLRGITQDNLRQLQMQSVMWGEAPVAVGGQLRDAACYLTAGDYVLVACGTGRTVNTARQHAYDAADAIRWPSNVMYRKDIGARLEEQLPILQHFGYCLDMKY